MPDPSAFFPFSKPFAEDRVGSDYEIKNELGRFFAEAETAADLYSLGAILYELLATPVKGEQTREAGLTGSDNVEGSDSITFACDLSGHYNSFPMAEPPIGREMRFC